MNRYFARQISAQDVVASYAGVRPLLEDESADPAKVTRDYALELDTHGAPILNVFGGKITTFRRLAEEAVDQVCRALRFEGRPWTELAVLPGGDLPGASLAVFLRAMARRFPWLPLHVRERYCRAYGTRMIKLIGAARNLAMMGEEVLPNLYEREIDYLCGYDGPTRHAISSGDGANSPCICRPAARRGWMRGSRTAASVPRVSSSRVASRPERMAGADYVLAIDQGTTSSRAIVFDRERRIRGLGQREHAQFYPRSGWVEHDGAAIWSTQVATIADALAQAGITARDLATIGITNQRETTLLWDRRSGEPVGPAIVWQDRRTAERCAALLAQG